MYSNEFFYIDPNIKFVQTQNIEREGLECKERVWNAKRGFRMQREGNEQTSSIKHQLMKLNDKKRTTT